MKATVKASDMAFNILEQIAFASEPQSQTEIAQAVGIVKSAAHKHLHTLQERGYVVRDTISARYSLGPKAWLIGKRATAIENLALVAEGQMRAVRNETGLAVVLCSVNAKTLSVISTFHGTHAIEIGVRQGSVLSLHASAQGRLLLAFGPPELSEEIYAQPLIPLTPKTITDPVQLSEQVRLCRNTGYAVAPEETLLGVNALAAPVFDHREEMIATVALIGSIQHLTPIPSSSHVEIIRRLAQSISSSRGRGMVAI